MNHHAVAGLSPQNSQTFGPRSSTCPEGLRVLPAQRASPEQHRNGEEQKEGGGEEKGGGSEEEGRMESKGPESPRAGPKTSSG